MRITVTKGKDLSEEGKIKYGARKEMGGLKLW